MTDHSQHDAHADHQHGMGCGHETFEHEGHTDYIHDGHSHAEHEGHWDEHAMRMGPGPEGGSEAHSTAGEPAGPS
jgi:hypothetical protein